MRERLPLDYIRLFFVGFALGCSVLINSMAGIEANTTGSAVK